MDPALVALMAKIDELVTEMRRDSSRRAAPPEPTRPLPTSPLGPEGSRDTEDQRLLNDNLVNIRSQIDLERANLNSLRDERKQALELGNMVEAETLGQEIKAAITRRNNAKQHEEDLNKQLDLLNNLGKAGEEFGQDLTGAFNKITAAMKTDQGFNPSGLKSIGESLFQAAGGAKGFFSMMENGLEVSAASLAKLKIGITNFAIKNFFEFLDAVFELATNFEKAEIAVRKATGASAEFAKDMRGVRADVIMTGASVQDLQEAQIKLAKGFTDFTMTGKESRQELLKVTTILDKLGFPAETAAKGIQDLTKGLGMSTSAAAGTMIEFEALGKDIGVSAGQMASDFEQVSDKVLMLGDLGPQAFKDMARTAKITGLEIGKLQKMTDKFDTFEGAAEQAGKLNAALGGNFVNAMDLMMTEDPTERFEMIRNSILDAGMSFEEMSYRQKQFYAEAMGLESVTELSQALSGDLDSLNGSLGENAATQEAAAKRAESLQTFQESLMNLLQSMIPVFSPFIDMLQGMAKFLQENAGAIKIVVGALLLLGGVIGVISTGGSGMPAFVGLLAAITGGMISFGDAGESSNRFFTMIGDSFDRLKDSLAAVFEQFAPLIKVFMLLAKGILVVLGGALGIVLSLFIDFIAIIVDAGTFLAKFAYYFSGIGFAIDGVAVLFQVFTDANYSLMDGIRDFFAVILMVFEPLISMFDTLLNSILGVVALIPSFEGVAGFFGMADAFSGFVKGTVASGESEGLGLTPMAEGGIVSGPTPALVGEAGPEAIIPLEQLATVAMSVIAAPMAAPVKAIQTLINNNTTTTTKEQTGPQQMVVNLTLDGKIIDKKVIDIVNKKALDSLVGL